MFCHLCEKPAAFILNIEIVPRVAVDIPCYNERVLLCLHHLEDPGPAMGWTTRVITRPEDPTRVVIEANMPLSVHDR